MQGSDFDETRASARLPHLDIDIVHRRSREGDAEQISINLQAVPSFSAFSQFLETANPFQFWARLAQLTWLPWLTALRSTSALPGFGHIPTSATPSRLPERTPADDTPSPSTHRSDGH